MKLLWEKSRVLKKLKVTELSPNSRESGLQERVKRCGRITYVLGFPEENNENERRRII